jgi:hypothetical protein
LYKKIILVNKIKKLNKSKNLFNKRNYKDNKFKERKNKIYREKNLNNYKRRLLYRNRFKKLNHNDMLNSFKNIKINKCKNREEINKFNHKNKNLLNFLKITKKQNLCINKKYKNK